MKKIISFLMLIVIVVISNGCASYMSYRYSQDEIAQRRIFSSNNNNAKEAIAFGVSPRNALQIVPLQGGAALMVDIGAIDAIAENPWRQLGAAIIDGAAAYTTYAVGERQGWWGSTSGANSPSMQININGNGNIVNINTGDSNSNIGNPSFSESK